MPFDATAYLTAPEPVVESQLILDLRAVRKRIEREEDWCGDQVSGMRGDAVCLGIAIDTTIPCSRGDGVYRALGFSNAFPLIAFNDSATHAQVLALIDRTIERCRSEGK